MAVLHGLPDELARHLHLLSRRHSHINLVCEVGSNGDEHLHKLAMLSRGI